ncbi:hypothetical protein RUM44_003639 [Polyplax serrata]|uniref:Uncharacterized protein n=1 Tax=Polyplax serrata TaxID=468196 RepID=A0ABR1AH15_POLSC
MSSYAGVRPFNKIIGGREGSGAVGLKYGGRGTPMVMTVRDDSVLWLCQQTQQIPSIVEGIVWKRNVREENLAREKYTILESRGGNMLAVVSAPEEERQKRPRRKRTGEHVLASAFGDFGSL